MDKDEINCIFYRVHGAKFISEYRSMEKEKWIFINELNEIMSLKVLFS